MVNLRWPQPIAWAVALVLLSACGAQPTPTVSPSAGTPYATATFSVLSANPEDTSAGPTAVLGIAATPTSEPTLDLAQMGSKTLIVLSTNDVAGYSEPCG